MLIILFAAPLHASWNALIKSGPNKPRDTALVMWRLGPKRGEAVRYMVGRAKVAVGGTAASLGSYAIALWAMTQAPVALVAALRETSVIFAAVIGTLLLGERFGWARAAGTGLVVAGVMSLRFG